MNTIRSLMCAGLLVCVTAIAAPVKAGECCQPCPPPTMVSFCVTDPCTCCSYTVCACLPACCCGEQPCLVACREGMFGRKTLTYRFPCCGECVDVLVTRRGARVK